MSADAYLERNKVVAALAKCFPSGIARTAIEGWSDDWHGCVYIDLPTGQVSWHYHDSHAALFEGLPPYTKPWDGHNTEEKYRRVAALKPIYDAALREELAQVKAELLQEVEDEFRRTFTGLCVSHKWMPCSEFIQWLKAKAMMKADTENRKHFGVGLTATGNE